MKFDVSVFFESVSKKINFNSNLTRIKGTSHKDQCLFLIISRSVLLRQGNVSDKSCKENQNTHFMFSSSFSKIVHFMR